MVWCSICIDWYDWFVTATTTVQIAFALATQRIAKCNNNFMIWKNAIKFDGKYDSSVYGHVRISRESNEFNRKILLIGILMCAPDKISVIYMDITVCGHVVMIHLMILMDCNYGNDVEESSLVKLKLQYSKMNKIPCIQTYRRMR